MEPATAAAASPAAGWFADPHAPNFLRWWDGMQWTHHVHPVAGPAQPQQGAGVAQHAGSHLAQVPAQQGAAQPAFAQHQSAAQSSYGHAGAVNPAAAAANASGYGATNVSNPFPAGASGFTASAASTGTGSLLTQPSSGSESLIKANPESAIAIGVSALYLVLAMTTGILMAGVIPAFATFRAFGRGEKLAPVALIAAAAAIAFSWMHMRA